MHAVVELACSPLDRAYTHDNLLTQELLLQCTNDTCKTSGGSRAAQMGQRRWMPTQGRCAEEAFIPPITPDTFFQSMTCERKKEAAGDVKPSVAVAAETMPASSAERKAQSSEPIAASGTPNAQQLGTGA